MLDSRVLWEGLPNTAVVPVETTVLKELTIQLWPSYPGSSSLVSGKAESSWYLPAGITRGARLELRAQVVRAEATTYKDFSYRL